jgi:hypothetical protein
MENIILFGHWGVPLLAWSSVAEPPLAVWGMIVRNLVLCPGLESSIRPGAVGYGVGGPEAFGVERTPNKQISSRYGARVCLGQ